MKRIYYKKSKEELNRLKSDYVIKTVEEYNLLAKKIQEDKNWFNEYIHLVRHYYDKHCSGGNLHVVLDDGNLENHHLEWSSGLCYGTEDHEGQDIADLMLFMNKKQREKVYRNYHLYGG